MITRFYVDNYKCLTNFEYKPKAFELVLGANGTGKTTVFEALDKLRRFLFEKEDARELFPLSCGTRWDKRPTQIFEVDFEAAGVEGVELQYRLEINLPDEGAHVEKETLKSGGKVFLESEWRELESSSGPIWSKWVMTPGGNYPNHVNQVRGFVTERSAIRSVFSQFANPNQSMMALGLRDAKDLSDIHLIKLNPPRMASQVGKAQARPANDLSNFPSYYSHLLQKKQRQVLEMLPSLSEVIPGFDSFTIEEDFEEGRRNLEIIQRRTSSKPGTAPLRFSFEELSDGQRALIALYTLLHCTLEPNTTLVIDEPENYVALRELQPWLSEMRERVEERGGQVILISHHPEFINALAPHNATLFKRDEGGPVRIVPFRTEGFEGLTPAEIVARGLES